MRRSRYKIHEPTHPHFVTCTILNWLPIFTRKESVDILIQSLKHLQKEENLKLYAYVILARSHPSSVGTHTRVITTKPISKNK